MANVYLGIYLTDTLMDAVAKRIAADENVRRAKLPKQIRGCSHILKDPQDAYCSQCGKAAWQKNYAAELMTEEKVYEYSIPEFIDDYEVEWLTLSDGRGEFDEQYGLGLPLAKMDHNKSLNALKAEVAAHIQQKLGITGPVKLCIGVY